MATSNRDRVGRMFEHLADGLEPFLARTLALPEGTEWTELVRTVDNAAPGKEYSRTDPALQLRMLTDPVTHRVKPGWRPFRNVLSRAHEGMANELKQTRNDWAHNKPFSTDDTLRALDTGERLLVAAGAPEPAEQVRRLRVDLQRISVDQQNRKVEKALDTGASSAGLLPWREVLAPHRDVASGDFHAAEFAADLWLVARGEGDAEYTDPVQFFRRTFLTGGLRDLIVRSVRRLTGDLNASPVINLQTNFGGGKTHSMLSLWHLASGTEVTRYPQELQELLAGLGPDRDLDTVQGQVKRVALVGNRIGPGEEIIKPDGTRVRTLWGELAWQLGGAEAYAIVADADRTSRSPGESLHTLLSRYAPAVILIDEWVAYARGLFGRDDLPGGDFDSQFTFAQALTETAKSVPGCLVVISIPASQRDDDATEVSDEEVGGENGREALRRLQNVVRRVADPWRAANAEESFEIVRRRLFESPDGEALASINATARAVVEFYRRNSTQFPREVTENEYVERIKRSYPVHPELFDRLYEDWSTLDRFQRTRGVLRLMNTIVGELWSAGDSSALIMPGTVPVQSNLVHAELRQYLDDKWDGVIHADVDGPASAPADVDKSSAIFGQRSVTKRLARTVFMGSVPTLGSAQKGLDVQRVFLGTALPGDVPGNFHPALNQLADKATYFYGQDSRYWYDTQANTTRTARDYAERLHADEVSAEVRTRLDAHRRSSPTGFARVVVSPGSTADVPDTDQVQLVLVPPTHPHDDKRKTDSPGSTWARQVVDRCGPSARTAQNMVVFLAPDTARMAELDAAVRDFLAWEHVRTSRRELNLTDQQHEQAVDRAKRASQTVTDRLVGTYVWVLHPVAQAGKPFQIEAVKAERQAPSLAERVAEKLHDEGRLLRDRRSSHLRMDLDGPLRAVWHRDDHIDVGQLWAYLTTYTYLPRLRDRAVLVKAVRSVADTSAVIAWEHDGYALAERFDPETGRYDGLWLPGDSDEAPEVTDSTLLVSPGKAVPQRAVDLRAAGEREPDPGREGEPEPGRGGSRGADGGSGGGGDSEPEVSQRCAPTRYFGVRALDPQRYAQDFAKLAQEVVAHLAATPGVSLEVRVEISATAPDGFDENRVRTVSENAAVLKFEQTGFEGS